MPDPTFSIALPVYNGEDYLAQALDSVLAQSFRDWELVVLDNASTDATAAILADYAGRDARIRCERAAATLPVVENFNRAAGLCRAPWIVFLCHDDLLLPQCLERFAAAVEQAPSRVALLGSPPQYTFANGYRSPAVPPRDAAPRHYDGRDYLRRALGGFAAPEPLPAMTGTAVRTADWHALGPFDARYQHCDTFLWYRFLLDRDYLVVPESLTVIRIHGAQGSAGVRRSRRSIREYREFFADFVRTNGTALQLPWLTRTGAGLRYVSVAATEMVIQLLKREYRAAAAVVREVPIVWYPLLLALCLRNARTEAARTGEVRKHVPIEMLYP